VDKLVLLSRDFIVNYERVLLIAYTRQNCDEEQNIDQRFANYFLLYEEGMLTLGKILNDSKTFDIAKERKIFNSKLVLA
jgi:hypothetical protein